MSTVASPPRAAQPAPPAPVRHGTCRLQVLINEVTYTCKRIRVTRPRGVRAWSLKNHGNGQVYAVAKANGEIKCSCPDATQRGAQCKHVRALVALGLLSARRRSGGGR